MQIPRKNNGRAAIRHPTSPIMLTGPRTSRASRSRKAQPPFRNCRILPSPFPPHRPAYGPQRPTCANPRQECRFWWEARGTPLGLPKCMVVYMTFAIVCLTSWIVLRITTENSQTARECTQRTSGPHVIFDGSSQPEK